MPRVILLALVLAFLPFTSIAQDKPAKPTQEEQRQQREAELKKRAEDIGKAAGQAAGVGMIVLLVLGGISFLLMLVPIVIAMVRSHPDTVAITVVSLLLGWTCVGWIVALVWSVKSIPEAATQSVTVVNRGSGKKRRRVVEDDDEDD